MSLIPGSPEWRANVERLRLDECAQPEQWWWLSFGTSNGWRGGCMVKARGFTMAVDEANRLGINPGGQVRGEPLGPEPPPDVPVNRLLSKDDLEMEKMQ